MFTGHTAGPACAVFLGRLCRFHEGNDMRFKVFTFFLVYKILNDKSPKIDTPASD